MEIKLGDLNVLGNEIDTAAYAIATIAAILENENIQDTFLNVGEINIVSSLLSLFGDSILAIAARIQANSEETISQADSLNVEGTLLVVLGDVLLLKAALLANQEKDGDDNS